MKQDRELIEASAEAAAEHCGPKINAAIEYVEKYTELPSMAFGVLPSVLLSGPYNEARDSQLRNLKDGKTKLKQMIDGLAHVAWTYDKSEAAATIPSDGTKKIEVKEPKGGTGALSSILETVGGVSGGITIGTAVVLRPHWVFSIVTKGASAKLCPLAILSVVTYMLLEPDDEALGKASGAWKQAAENLKNIGELETVLGLSDTAWGVDNPSRKQFNSWLAAFQVELNDAQTSASGQAAAIEGVIKAIRGIQLGMVITDIACLIAMIAFKIMEMFPLTKPAGVAGKIGVAITENIATKTVAAVVMGWISAWITGAIALADAGKFKKMEVEPGGTEQTFIDLEDPMKGWATAG